MKFNWLQILRLVMMILAIAGIIYAIEYMDRSIAVWFWVSILGIGFVSLLYLFRLSQRRLANEDAYKQRQQRKKASKSHRGNKRDNAEKRS